MKKLILFIILVSAIGNLNAQRRMENLGRGVVATRTATSSAFISWRLLGNDPKNIGFNVYKSVAGATAVKQNSSVLMGGTNYTDNTMGYTLSNTYFVKPVINSIEQDASGMFTLSANSAIEPCVVVPLKAGSSIHLVSVGDLDGDGEYDFVVDRIDFTTASEKLEAYKKDGTFLWTIDLGTGLNLDNISPGPTVIDVGMWDGFTVYDMDGDGKAEVLLRTAAGVTFGDGSTLTNANSNVQFISVIDGMTGAEKARVQLPTDYLATGPLACSMGIGYLNGVTPSLVGFMKNRNADGSFNRLMVAWDYNGTAITQKWKNNLTTAGSDGHQMRILDFDGDGKDEIGEIGFVLKGDGSLLYNLGASGIYHGDRWHVGKLDPNRAGLQGYGIQQDNIDGLIEYYYDAGTGKIIWKHSTINVGDAARGEAGDIDPRTPGYEAWSFSGLYNAPANKYITSSTPYPNFRIWWDGDVLSENYNDGKIEKWDYASSTVSRSLTAWNYESATGSDRAAPMFYGDIMGDWREEVVMASSDYSKLVIFTSPIATNVRLYTLAQNPEYRNSMTVKGYLQSHMLDYYLGSGMTTPPTPPIQTAKSVWKGNSTNNVWDESTSNWMVNGTSGVFTQGDDVMFDISGSSDTTVVLSGTLNPASIKVISALNYSFNGTGNISGSTGILKSGNGTLSFNCPLDYTDTTKVEQGALYVNSILNQSPVLVSFGAQLGGSGTISQPVMLNKGAMVSPGKKGSTGTLTFAKNLTMPSNSFALFDITNDSTNLVKPSDKIVISGNLVISDTITVVVNKFNGVVYPGSYPLIAYTGTFTGNLKKIGISGLFGQKYAVVNNAGVIYLTIEAARDAAKVSWNGSSNTWDLQTTPAWTLDGNPVTFVANDTIAFDSTGVTNPTVKLVGTLPVSNMLFDTSNSNYTLNGTGNIGGTGSLTKNGVGVLSMQTTNSFTGKTVVNAGTLEVATIADAGANSSIGANTSVAPSEIVLNNAVFRLSGSTAMSTNKGMTLNGINDTISSKFVSSTMTIQGVIAGTANLIKTGYGILNLQKSANTFKGNTIVKTGTLSLGDEIANTNGISTGSLTLENATLTMYSSSSTYTNFYSNIIVPTGMNATMNTDVRCNYQGTLTGGGTFNVYLPGTIDRTIFFGNWSAFTGTVNLTGVSGTNFRIANSYGYAKATINLGDNVGIYHGGTGTNGGDAVATTVTLGALSGNATSTVWGENWVIGDKNIDSRFNGTITGNSITKVGKGTLTLSGNNTYSGGTTISNGTLMIVNTTGSGTGTGSVAVNSTGTLAGTGIISGAVSVASGGTLSPGVNAIGKLTINNNLTLYPGSNTIIEAKKSPNANDVISSTGTINLGGTLNIINTGSTAFAAGDSLVIFNATKYVGSFSSIVPAIPGDGLKWNTSRITSGIISVDVADGMEDVTGDNIRVYPTVVNNYCLVEFGSLNGEIKVELIDEVAKVLISHQITFGINHRLDMNSFHSGFYFVRISSDKNQHFIRKVIKM